ncbi:MAG TPA: CocE/NonD family hydrolase [Steroidobacteraceae bacterium]|nr:CocE/NonD family hydrolase [Steroidobacteraceae bacterium]
MTKTSMPTRAVICIWAATTLFLSFAAASWAGAEAPDLDFHAPPTADGPTTPAVMRDLAERLLPVYQEPDPDRYLASLSVLQMVAGDYAAADASRRELRNRRPHADLGQPVGRGVIYDIYSYAKTIEVENRVSFAQSLAKSFNEVVAPLNDHDSYVVTRWLGISAAVFRGALQRSLDQQRAKDIIDQTAALELLRTYLSYVAYRNFGPLVESLVAADERRRYTVDSEVVIKIPDGTSIVAVVVRPRSPSKPLPTLLEFTIDATQDDAMECAAHGYVGVVAYARGTRASPRRLVPFHRVGDAARAAISWIAKQPWSDGRVGMYGDGYGGFTAWSAAKRVPSALKAIATSAPNAPGIDVPMAGSVFHNSAYRWSLNMSTTEASSEEEDDDDDALWRVLDQNWYRSGRRYRDLGRLLGRPNPIFIRWLNHPSYDGFWRKLIPFREQFAHINIPVLTTTGYFAASEPGALYYFTQHYRNNPRADHTLVIGPYDDGVMQSGPTAVLHGYQVDSAALIDLHELQYQWFDHVLKGGATPPVLMGRINYEVMGANEWRHAPSLEAMAGDSLKFYLDATASGERRRLTRRKSATPAFISQRVNFADRSDYGWMPPTDLISSSLATHNDITFVSEPLAKPIEFSGLFSGRLDFTVNKMDMDLNIMLYERLASGDYVRLFNPIDEFRASYAQDRVDRHLLRAGERQELTFRSERMTSRRLQAGSRLVLVLGINKRPDREINYGTGGDVSEESLADAKIPLKIRWHSDSYIEIPVRR